MRHVYMYVVDRDFGFAPNPFHGYCTLATCKPVLRKKAEIGDWIIGMGGKRLGATGRCVYAMCVTQKLTFNEYWSSPLFFNKRPVRNGSQKMMVGDNIYHHDDVNNEWHQADSHHSNSDGSINYHNLNADTKCKNVLISDHFFYFGSKAPCVPSKIIDTIGYRNGRGHRVFHYSVANNLIEWLQTSCANFLNQNSGDPFDFNDSQKRYSPHNNKVF